MAVDRDKSSETPLCSITRPGIGRALRAAQEGLYARREHAGALGLGMKFIPPMVMLMTSSTSVTREVRTMMGMSDSWRSSRQMS